MCSLENQPSSNLAHRVDPENYGISQIFLDAIKSAWLLVHIRGETALLEGNQTWNNFTNLIERVSSLVCFFSLCLFFMFFNVTHALTDIV
jgi:hypothetical protein